MQLFYSHQQNGDILILEGEEAHHCVNVLRNSTGSQINVTNGKGSLFSCTIIDKTKTIVRLKIDSEQNLPTPQHASLTIAIAPTKNIDRFEWFVEKVTEIGIGRIIPLKTKRTERSIIKQERLMKLAISAMKQSNHYYLPDLSELTSFDELLKESNYDTRLIAHCMSDQLKHISEYCELDKRILVCIGPEGDFTAEEVAAAEVSGFKAISLGNSRLRTETAGIYACISYHHSILQ